MTHANRYSNLEALTRRVDCPHDYACLGDQPVCGTAKYTSHDVEILLCQCSAPCERRSNVAGMLVCTCPVARKIHLNA